MKRIFYLFLFLACVNVALAAESVDKFPCESIVASDSVRIRASPSLTAEIVGRADTGAIFTVLGQSENSMALADGTMRFFWYKLDLGNKKIGWIYGGFLLLYPNEESGNLELSFQFKTGQTSGNFKLRLYYQDSDLRGVDEASEFVYFPVFREAAGKLYFVYIPDGLVQSALSLKNENHWYSLVSSDQGWQELTLAQVDKNSGALRLTMVQHLRGIEQPSVKILVCSFNNAKNFFQVDQVE